MESPTSTSVRQRLLNLARVYGEDYNQVLIRYAGLRFLARLASSDHANMFLLKGATMFLVWNGSIHRPTSDIDLLGFFEEDEQSLTEIMRSVCNVVIDSDGMLYDGKSIKVEPIREDASYGGLRCVLNAFLGTAKLRVQVDIGFGDVVTPIATRIVLPTMLKGEESLEMKAYTRETVIAEKVHAIATLGLSNSRMKDYFDLDYLLTSTIIDHSTLANALIQTFQRRRTCLPTELPLGLTDSFWKDETAVDAGLHLLPETGCRSVRWRISTSE